MTLLAHHRLLTSCESGALLLDGANFSGRTDALRAAIKSLHANGPVCFIPPEVDEAVSGLAATVADELVLGSRRPQEQTDDLSELLDFGADLHQNPLTLSGGEKMMLVLLAAFSRRCGAIAIDVALEQLDSARRERFVRSIPIWIAAGTSLLIADNRSTDLKEAGAVRIVLPPHSARGFKPQLSELPAMPPPLMPPAGLTLEGITFGYDRRPVLSDFSATLRPGVIYHLQGVNGSGKSTLAKILIGRLRPWSGTLTYGEAAVDPSRSPGRIASYHFQDPDVQLFTTEVRRELMSSGPRRAHGTNIVVDEMAAAFGLSHCLADHPFDLPYVLRKRLAIAATLCANAPWVILDEPTLGQDDDTSLRLSAMARSLAAQGRGVIVISHSREFVRLFDCVPIVLPARDSERNT